MTLPPCRTRRSLAAPSAGLADTPEYPSDPPHCSATVSALSGAGSRTTAFASSSTSRTNAIPASTVLRVPPISWMSMLRTRPASRCSCSRPPIWFTSHPSPITTMWEKLTCRAYPASVRRSTRSGSPSVMPHPVLCVSATTPSTFGHAASGSGRPPPSPAPNGSRRNASATRFATCALQFTLVSSPM